MVKNVQLHLTVVNNVCVTRRVYNFQQDSPNILSRTCTLFPILIPEFFNYLYHLYYLYFCISNQT